MVQDRTFHDSYYAVAQLDWLATIALISAVLVSLSFAVQRWSASPVALRLRRLVLASWAFGLLLILGTTIAWRYAEPRLFVERIWLIEFLDNASAVGIFLLLLALGLGVAMILAAIWNLMFRSRC